jgi:MbtH protein
MTDEPRHLVTHYLVVRNDEEQYSIWDAATEPPAGWYPVGFSGTRAECLAHIEQVWTDTRPRRVRRGGETA